MKRLSRLDEIFAENPVYFITACTYNRAKILDNEDTHQVFLTFCRQARSHGAMVGRYVLMPDHLHLFVCITTAGIGLSAWVKSLKNTLSKNWRQQGCEAPHWQKGFFDHLLRSDQSHAEKWLYVKENPVRAGLCQAADDWPYGGQILTDSSI